MDSKEKSLAKNTAIIFLGKFCTQFISFFLVPLYTRCLATEEYGSIDLITTYLTLLIPIILLQIENAVFRFLLDKRDSKGNQKVIISTVSVFSLITFTLFGLAFIAVGLFIDIPYVAYIVASAFAMVCSSITLQIVRGLGDTVKYAIGSVISGVSNVVLNIITVVMLGMGVEGILLSLAVSNILCSAYLSVASKLYKYVNIKLFDTSILKDMLKYSVPLIPNGVSWWVVNVSDRTIISIFMNVAANGIYAVANKFSNLFNGLFNVLSITWTESVCVNINKDNAEQYFDKMVRLIFRMFSYICLGIISVMPFVFNILIGKEYAEAYYHIPILMIAIFFNVMSSTFSAFFVALKKTGEMMWSTIGSAIINLVINVIFIKRFGLYAASISTFIAYLFMAVYRYVKIRKYVSFRIGTSLILRMIVVAAMILYSYYFGSVIIQAICAVYIIGDFIVTLVLPNIKNIKQSIKKRKIID